MEPNKKGSDALAKRISWKQNPTSTKKLHRSSYTKSAERKVKVLIACVVHGPQPGVMISPDLSPYSSTNAAVRIVDLTYEYNGEIVWEFHVSEAFGKLHQLIGGTKPLPEQPDEWVRELHGCCRACFEEKHHGKFGKNGQWIENP